jgi:hypothetical protein
MPIVALVEFETLDGVQIFYSDGKNENHREYDLFFADEELTEFEKEILNLLNCATPEGHGSPTIEKTKEYSQKLIDLARKEILKDLPEWKKNLLPNIEDCTGFNSENFCYKGYYINYQELFGILPKEE